MKWMEHLDKSALGMFKSEPGWLEAHRASSFASMRARDNVDFKYGLNIRISPKTVPAIVPAQTRCAEVSVSSDERIDVLNGTFPEEDICKKFLKIGADDVFNDFHEAFVNDVVFIHIPEAQEVDQITSIGLKIKDRPTISSIFILAEPRSISSITITSSDNGEARFMSSSVKVIAKESSKVTVECINALGKKTVNIQRRHATCEKDAEVRWIDACLGTDYTKTDIHTDLEGRGSSTTATVVFTGNEDDRHDVFTGTTHNAPDTSSRLTTRGILNGKAKALSRGLIRITANAPNSSGYEKQDALLLSADAEADAIPNLEIENHDVKCSHGATIGQLDKEELFYLMSRGLDESEATRTIISGYFAPVMGAITDDVKNKVDEAISRSV